MKKPPKRKSEPHVLEDQDSFSGLSRKRTIELDNGEVISEYEWKRRFDTGWYFGDRFGDQGIALTKEQEQVGIRNKNNRSRDALIQQDAVDDEEKFDYDVERIAFMEEASDDWDWQNAYKQLGYESAVLVIYEQAERDLKNGKINVKITLTRFLTKMSDLNKLKRREGRK